MILNCLRVRPLVVVWAAALAGAIGTARADYVPASIPGATVHLDPFKSPAWDPHLGAWPGFGQVFPSMTKPNPNSLVPDPQYDLLGGFSVDTKAGNDNLVSPNNGDPTVVDWIWENEYDLNPSLPGLNGQWFLLRVITPVASWQGLGMYQQGPDLILNVLQSEASAGLGETGGFTKTTINLTDRVIGWGTSVQETPFALLAQPDQQRKSIALFSGDSANLDEPVFLFNTLYFGCQYDPVAKRDVWSVWQTPLPPSLYQGAILGLAALAWRLTRHRKAFAI